MNKIFLKIGPFELFRNSSRYNETSFKIKLQFVFPTTKVYHKKSFDRNSKIHQESSTPLRNGIPKELFAIFRQIIHEKNGSKTIVFYHDQNLNPFLNLISIRAFAHKND